MSHKPILVLQMQRMGDLILSFPLLSLLQRRFPQHPLWTVAEPRFFSELFRFTPNTVFFPPSAEGNLRTAQFHSVINLSHRQDAASIAGSLEAESYYGAVTRQGTTHIHGDWALYRAAIVHNNRHNLFHWSDLQLLDHLDKKPLPPLHAFNTQRHTSNKVGLFVGASEEEKRPSPDFFALLAKSLLRKGWKPLFLGGPEDVALGQEAMRLSGIPHSSLCGQLSLSQLADIMNELALFITPDTGPMHLATWVGTPVLNVSMGPVNAWETGPLLPGHYVLRPKLSCVGCWQCQSSPLRCRSKFHPGRVALVAHTLMRQPDQLASLRLPGLSLLRTGRDGRGLFQLTPISSNTPSSARHLLSQVWQNWFLTHHHAKENSPICALENLREKHPQTIIVLRKATLHMGREIRSHLRNELRGGPHVLPNSFWHKLPPILRPFSGHMHLYLQNEAYSRNSWQKTLENIEQLIQILK